MSNSYYSPEELKQFNFKSFGSNVLISRKASLYATEKMSFGSNVRIDDFSMLSGNLEIGSYIHIGAYSGLYANKGKITISDFSGISSKCTIYTSSDDYSGLAMSNPMVPEKYTNITVSEIVIGKHALIGTGSVILPGSHISEGVSVGAMSLVGRVLDPWGVYFGIPCKRINDRKKDLLEMEKLMINEEKA